MSELQISSLTIASSQTTLVRDVTFQISPSSSHGLIGESGSGKSITARAILGLLPPSLNATGSITLNGLELLGSSESERVQRQGLSIAYIPQDPLASLDPTMRIGRHFHTRRNDQSQRAVRELLDAVELSDHESILRSYPHQLSGGQRQRILIALALTRSPELIIADEPTSALDAGLQGPIMRLITSLARQRGSSLLLISHDIALVAAFTSELSIVYRGSLCETGATVDLLQHQYHPYSADLIGRARSFYQPSALSPSPRTVIEADEAEPYSSSHERSEAVLLRHGCPYSRVCRSSDSQCESVLPPLTARGPSSFRCFHPSSSIESKETRDERR
jgi:ABC-type dipeptide/oligopeptide/nickel transport system ATPase component